MREPGPGPRGPGDPAAGAPVEGGRPWTPTRRETLRRLTGELEAAGIESPEANAERLLAHATGLSRADLAASLDAPLEPAESARLAQAARRRLRREPLQHIEGVAAFRELELAADERALVPRPETEQLVELVARWAHRRAAAGGVLRVRRPGAPAGPPPLSRVLDVGTGGGAIALALVAEGVAGRCVGIDVSRRALEQARENRRRAGLEDRVELRRTDGGVWDALGPREGFDAIVSNPPYVAATEAGTLPPEVGRWEPPEALFGGEDGLDVVRTLAAGAPGHLEPGGGLFLEIGAGQGAAVRELLLHGPWAEVEIRPDLTGRERFAVGLLPPSGERLR